MHCQKCGVEVAEQAVFCHKCGERIDFEDRHLPPFGQDPQPPVPDASSQRPPEEAEAQPAGTPAEEFKQAVASGRQPEDEPERELWQGGYSTKAMIGAWCLSGLITVGLLILMIWFPNKVIIWIALVAILLLWLYQLLKLCYRRMNVRYRLTTQRFIHETGIFRRVTDRIETIDMDDITFEQTFLERLVGVGSIRVTSSDRTHPELVLLGIENVKEVAGIVDEIRRSERRRRGLHIESI